MAKKKREHIVFDQMLKVKKSIPFSKINSNSSKPVRGRKDIPYECNNGIVKRDGIQCRLNLEA